MGGESPTDGRRALISSAAPEFAIEDLEMVPSTKPYVQYFATAPEEDSLMLSLLPRTTRLLRSEYLPIKSEAVLLRWLTCPADEPCPAVHAGDAEPDKTNLAVGAENGIKRRIPRCTKGLPLLQFLPRLIKHGSATHVGCRNEYLLTRPVVGTTIAALSRPLDRAERKHVDFQVGQLLRRISSQLSPNGKFGTAVGILSPDPDATGSSWYRADTPDLSSRHDRWSDAFRYMLESTLRDAEDFNVTIPYDAIRDHVSRLRHFLDAVTSPCLVAIDAGEDTNTLVSPVTRSLQESGCRLQRDRPPEQDKSGHGDDAIDANESADVTARAEGLMEVTGIREWSNCVFGDPLFASVLSRSASPDIWDGFKSALWENGLEVFGARSDPLEDLRNAESRRLLYECYHAATAIVREYYRRSSDDREMPARKRLTQALRKLDNMDDIGKERRPHPSGEVSPAKRPKIDDEDSAGE
ncbi:hypothetical protein TOPH_02140 [Tolypocladium ophioglossoides CBS 100239]|uniref:Aminoglycoside phosphotransferase domain-containing protein n=1 Tax=Tolypocladium ophioglossoides (strain CBS 100239) TaxID=1163406 RepID=A0A0L0NHW2_TOLOC|nr:hypothetical protein TOPH_02140 [Tolypocladium ophioglossoides CBS 100239]